MINWITDHDNKRLFIVLYIGTSLVLSIAISLFWLLFAVLVHFAFELISQSRKKEGAGAVVLESLWETKLDFALVVFALWLAVYLDFIFGVAGIGAVARAGAQSASRAGAIGGKAAEVTVRFAAWNRVIRAALLSLDDVGNAIKAVYQGKRAKRTNRGNSAQPNPETAHTVPSENELKQNSSWTNKWGAIDYIGAGLFLVSAIMILLAPSIIPINFEEILSITKKEFHPFP